jgi:hypothetical protein
MRIRFMPSSTEDVMGERVWLAVSVVLGIVCAWAGRYSMISDGISYLDLGDYYLHGDWSNVANAHWSPMYPWLLGIAMKLVKPSLWWQFPVVHVVNYFVFLWALFCFRYFMNTFFTEHKREQESLTLLGLFHLPEWALRGMGYLLFLWSSLVLIGIWLVSPDLLLSGWIYLAAAQLTRLRDENSYAAFLRFGAVLGAAYWCKTVMFPLAFVLMGITLLSGRSVRPRIPRIIVAVIVFLLVSAPLILLLSREKGRLTFGDSGSITYAWLVSPGTPEINPVVANPASLLHPTRKILEHPPVYEFAQPIGGTFPPWFDPSYWNEGLRPVFRLSSQVRALVESLTIYSKLLLAQAGWLTGVVIFVLMGRLATARGIAKNWPVLGFPLLALALYAFVLARPRYAGAFLLVLCVGVLAGIRLPKRSGYDQFARWVALGTMIVMMFSIAEPLLEMTYEGLSSGNPWLQTEPMRVAEGLHRLGLQPGEHVATIGVGITDFWARLGGFKIVAQIMPGDRGQNEFWRSSPEQKRAVYEALASSGARALIAFDSSDESLGPGWQKLPGTYHHVYLLSKQSIAGTP